ncbi:MAG: hypothetical protein ACJAT2_000078 [Bacteriovoracaceae bacterium]|jgi:hypothetical protein
MKNLIMMMCLSVTLIATPTFAKDKDRSLSEVISELGDSAYRVKKKNCTGGGCSHIPYEYETEFFWLKKSEKKRRRARNIQRRNEWLLKSGLFPTDAEVEARSVKKKQAELEKALKASQKKSEMAARILKEKQAKLKALQDKRDLLVKKREAAIEKTRDIFNSTETATAGSETLLESGKGLLKGKAPLRSTEDEDKILAELDSSQKELRSVIKEMRDLGSEVSEVQRKTAGVDQASYDKLIADVEAGEKALEKTVQEYGEVVSRVQPEKQRRAAEVQLINQKTKIQAAQDFAKQKVKEIKKSKDLAEFILKDLDDVKKDLKLTELEAKVLNSEIGNTIQSSILGQYIRQQNEKTLQVALQGACETAKLCNQHESINNSHIQKNISPVYEKLKEQLGSKEK